MDEFGCPNVSPKEMFIANSKSKLLIANIASPESVSNIKINPAVCVSFVNVFKQKGFKLKGKAKIITKTDSEYSALSERLYTLGGKGFDIKSVIEASIESIFPIIAPSYWLFPETTEQNQIDQAMNIYGVSKKT